MSKKKKKSALWKNLLILLVTIIIVLLVSEVIFRIVFSIKHRGDWFRKEHDLDEYLTHVYNDSFRPGIEKYSFDKEDNVFRIAVIGDSFTDALVEGPVTALDYNLSPAIYPIYLEFILDHSFDDYEYEVYNFGVSGSLTLDQYFVLKEFAMDYNPDFVIVQTADNDLDYRMFNLDPFEYCDINASFSEKTLYLLCKNWKLFGYLYPNLVRKFGLYDGYYYNNDYYINYINRNNPVNVRCYVTSIYRLNSLLEEKEIPNLVFFIDPPNGNRTFFNEIFSSAGFEYVVTNHNLHGNYPSFLASDGFHYNANGNLILAKDIFNYMLMNEMIPSCENYDCTSKLIEVKV